MGGEILLAIAMVFASLCVPFCLVIVLAHFASKVITARVFIWIDRICAVVFGLFGLFLFYNGCLLMLEL